MASSSGKLQVAERCKWQSAAWPALHVWASIPPYYDIQPGLSWALTVCLCWVVNSLLITPDLCGRWTVEASPGVVSKPPINI